VEIKPVLAAISVAAAATLVVAAAPFTSADDVGVQRLGQQGERVIGSVIQHWTITDGAVWAAIMTPQAREVRTARSCGLGGTPSAVPRPSHLASPGDEHRPQWFEQFLAGRGELRVRHGGSLRVTLTLPWSSSWTSDGMPRDSPRFRSASYTWL